MAILHINKKRKTYLGIFSNQEEAAKTFDFYWMLLNKLAAKTNIDNTKENADQNE